MCVYTHTQFLCCVCFVLLLHRGCVAHNTGGCVPHNATNTYKQEYVKKRGTPRIYPAALLEIMQHCKKMPAALFSFITNLRRKNRFRAKNSYT